MTRKVILQIDVTLDGFIGDESGDMGWVRTNEAMNQAASDLLSTVDTILLGRVAYQDFVQFWPFADTTAPTLLSKITGQINRADKLIFSKTLDHVEWGAWNNAKLIQDNIPETITQLKSQPGKDLLLYAGSRIISTFMQNDLIDEYYLRVHPLIAGQGKPLFGHIDHPHNLKLVDTKSYASEAVVLHYQRL